jgi:hypothetical protein
MSVERNYYEFDDDEDYRREMLYETSYFRERDDDYDEYQMTEIDCLFLTITNLYIDKKTDDIEKLITKTISDINTEKKNSPEYFDFINLMVNNIIPLLIEQNNNIIKKIGDLNKIYNKIDKYDQRIIDIKNMYQDFKITNNL